MCKVNECSAGSLEAHAGLRGMNSGKSECSVNYELFILNVVCVCGQGGG